MKKLIRLIRVFLFMWRDKEAYRVVDGDLSDNYHTFRELYNYRMYYNAALFNEWARLGLYDVQKSFYHSDGKLCFGGGWFIVTANLPTGQISNHYKMEHYDLFRVPSKWHPTIIYDNHTPADVALRLKLYLENNHRENGKVTV